MRLPLLCLVLASSLFAGPDKPWPQTIPEATRHARTSTVAEVRTFMEALRKRNPALVPYHPKGAPKTTEAGAPLLAWRLPATAKDAVRVYINANIHAGEVEGKEAVQVLVRELLQGKHPELRKHIDLVICPAYNADGTDGLDPAIRRHQPNPASGVGRRENARGLDLNRDLMKVQAANTRWFLALLQDFDPAVVFDLHTTNGSYHGFHLTYAPALALGADADLLTFNRRLLVEVRETLKKEGLPTYDYGNFAPEERGGGAWAPDKVDTKPERWETFDALPRYLSNYPALQGRLGILSEEYVYRSYPDRIADTRRFVTACLGWIAAHPAEVNRTIAAARRLPAKLPLGAELKETERATFDLVDPIKNAQGQVTGEKSQRSVELPSFVTFAGKDFQDLPAGYLVDAAFAERVRPVLEAHGLKVLPGRARSQAPVRHFKETGRTVAKGAFQGVLSLDLQGAWTTEAPARARTLPWDAKSLDAALYIPVQQRHGRLAFYLLDPRSPDGLVHWGFFHEVLLRSDGSWGTHRASRSSPWAAPLPPRLP
ncbi:MAG: hypothetical protein IPL96_08290 [Holophagaceae bacterium]|nr:hypothetical protein [Holophagaceae bacterium]